MTLPGRKRAVVLIPGGVMPADFAYADLRGALGADVDVIANDHAVYAGDVPPAHYSLDLEAAAIMRAADERGFERFHLVGSIRAIKGTGLGLAFARDLARFQAGEMGFTSTEGEGSTFWVDVPLAPSHS